MMKIRNICILGGTGFVGHHLANELCERGHRIKVLTRRPQQHRDLLVLPTLRLREADVHDPAVLTRELAGQDVVINLVGILNESGHDGSGFRQVHAELAAKVAAACAENEVRQLLHMSALGADATEGPSFYLRSKGEGERLVKEKAADEVAVTIFRPSVIFGPGDSFVTRFASMLKWTPVVFPLPCPQARYQPVYVGDVVHAFANSIDNRAAVGQTFSLGGPRQYTLREIVALAAHTIGRRRWILGLPDWLSHLQAQVMEYLPGKPFSMDNYRSTLIPNVCTENHLETVFRIHPLALEALAPVYLVGRNARSRFTEYRKMASRDDILRRLEPHSPGH